MKVEIEIPDSCGKCGFKNMYIWGTKYCRENGDWIEIKVRCMRCGFVCSERQDHIGYIL